MSHGGRDRGGGVPPPQSDAFFAQAEAYFVDQYTRVWQGLVNLIAAYEDPASGLAHSATD